ncbi:SiaB family protein kinase [Eisenibacter elegans]|jgi:hypothetical protein|uniref:SiaB family protein kinase n=1 Tax=Eisenibacter elegans TaxID=997 RepID=UPI0004222429|nr:SiaB family protein kinase [Eisenibacter elegans]
MSTIITYKPNEHLTHVRELRQQVAANPFFFIYEGEITHTIMLAARKIVESYLKQKEEKILYRKRCVHLIVECVQNTIKHSNHIPTPENLDRKHLPLIMFGQEDDQYTIVSGNLIKADNVALLANYLDYLNGLSEERLMMYYRRAIKSVMDWGRKGKMGFIEMVLKSGNTIQYDFAPVGEDLAYFTYMLTINRHLLLEGNDDENADTDETPSPEIDV